MNCTVLGIRLLCYFDALRIRFILH